MPVRLRVELLIFIFSFQIYVSCSSQLYRLQATIPLWAVAVGGQQAKNLFMLKIRSQELHFSHLGLKITLSKHQLKLFQSTH